MIKFLCSFQESSLIRQQQMDQNTTASQTTQPVYIQLNPVTGENNYIQGVSVSQPANVNQAGAFIYSREHSSFIPYNQASINASHIGQTVVSSVHQAQRVMPNVNQLQPAVSNVNLTRTVLSNIDQVQPVVSNVNHAKTVVSNIHPSQTVVSNIHPVQTVLSNIHPSQTVLSNIHPSQTVVSNINPSVSQTFNSHCSATITGSSPSLVQGGHRIQSSATNSAFVTVSKPNASVVTSGQNVTTFATKIQPSEITVVYPGSNKFVKQRVSVTKGSAVHVPESAALSITAGGLLTASGDPKNQNHSVAFSPRQGSGSNPVKDSYGTHMSLASLNLAKNTVLSDTRPVMATVSTVNSSLCVPSNSDKVIQVQTITDPNMLQRLLGQVSSAQTPVSSTKVKPVSVNATFMGDLDSTRHISGVIQSHGNLLIQENPPPQVAQASSVQATMPSVTNLTPPSYTYIFNPTTTSSGVHPVTVDIGHAVEPPSATAAVVAAATNMDSNTAPTPGGAMNCVTSPNLGGLASQDAQTPPLVAIDPNLLIRLCQQAFSYQALDPSKGKVRKPQ